MNLPHMKLISSCRFFYGDEPYNRFAKRQAKFASNAIREDILVNICNCGIIFTPGQAGTRTEIFQ